MKQSIKKRWIKALRSGEYNQATESLCIHKDGEDSFCCLGVLTDLYLREKGLGWKKRNRDHTMFDDEVEYTYGKAKGLLPLCVADWAGFKSFELDNDKKEKPWLKIIKASEVTVKTTEGTLDDLNDCGSSFDDIADIIDREL